MKFEHFALNVDEPEKVAEWYVKHCGMTVAMKLDKAPHTHFLKDSGGRVICEFYNNSLVETPDYRSQHPLLFHFALAVKDAKAEGERLIAAGATSFENVHLDDGSILVMLRDPFGIPLQLCQRGFEW